MGSCPDTDIDPRSLLLVFFFNLIGSLQYFHRVFSDWSFTTLWFCFKTLDFQ